MINAVTLEFVEAHSLDVNLLSNLVNRILSVNGFGRLFSQHLGLQYHKGSDGRSVGL